MYKTGSVYGVRFIRNNIVFMKLWLYGFWTRTIVPCEYWPDKISLKKLKFEEQMKKAIYIYLVVV